ncbi:carbohydrate binding domain-containing protein [Paenibacillus arenosi]|uniref:Carbohydrate binding domain-containing protein n=1 Tax=Paenibacillus arenosi TaxID=2774142 RepID=A0ABR9AT09_9BACL|nr:carbohydrate binding domain-containing protein [Paenibacillus arenosi]MBD8497235.1 carbohydrate binding domain-containing protein [Paenibacillus arenosi]
MPSRKIGNRKAVRKHKNHQATVPSSRNYKTLLLPQPTQATIKNPGFENRTLSPWNPGPPSQLGQIFVTTVTPHSGLQAARMLCVENTVMALKQKISNLKRGRSYQVSMWLRRNVVSTLGQVRVRLGGLPAIYGISAIPMNTYRQFIDTFQIPGERGNTSFDLEIFLFSSTIGTDITIDDVSITLLGS